MAMVFQVESTADDCGAEAVVQRSGRLLGIEDGRGEQPGRQQPLGTRRTPSPSFQICPEKNMQKRNQVQPSAETLESKLHSCKKTQG
jgi:hypothetical protein